MKKFQRSVVFPLLSLSCIFSCILNSTSKAQESAPTLNVAGSTTIDSDTLNQASPIMSDPTLVAPYFLDIASLKIKSVLPPPPGDPSNESLPKKLRQKLSPEQDYLIQQQAIATATPEEINYAMNAIEDSVFDYSEILGDQFNATNCPLTAAFFDKVRNDVDSANLAAKNAFQHNRPATWRKMSPDDTDFGYSYPSGHTMRAYVWAILLSKCLPLLKTALLQEAHEKAWGRVIIGRHFPSDVAGGKIFAFYLVKEFFKNQEFQTEWSAVEAEIKSIVN